MEIITTYKRIKHGYVKRLANGDLRLSIPRRRRFDAGLKNRLIEKGKALAKRSTQTTAPIQRETATHVVIWGVWVEKSTLPNNLPAYLKEICYKESKRLADIYSATLGIPYNQLRIKKVKTKRGSCSSKQNININKDLLHLDPQFLEYVIIHEVCHLKHKHHQKSFWDEVAGFSPKYKDIVKQMRHIHFI